jgi:hypothetical protein
MTSPIPSGYNEILNALMAWGNSGLIPDTKLIKSYHPPAIDNITGVPILMPATTYETGSSESILKSLLDRDYSSISELPSASYSAPNVKDWNVNDIPTGPDTSLSHLAPIYGPFFKQAALTSADEKEYQKNTKKIDISVVAERLTENFDEKPVKITDNFDDAKNFYKTQPLTSGSGIGGLTSALQAAENKKPIDTRRPIPRRYELVPTKVPCAIPGVLNCYMEIYDKVDTTQPTYTYEEPVVTTTTLPDSLRTLLKTPLESAIEPVNPQLSDLWYDTENNELFVYDGSTWQSLGNSYNPVYTLKGEKNY